MRRLFTVILALPSVSFFVVSCSSSKMSRDNYVPFTRDLKAKLEKENIDLKQVQFYVDQKLILNRNLGDEKIAVTSGVVRLENGKYINEVIVPSFTPGICEGIEGDKLMISFEKGNNNRAFGPGSGYTFNEYVLYGTEWKNGTAAVMQRWSSGSNTSATDMSVPALATKTNVFQSHPAPDTWPPPGASASPESGRRER